MDVFNINWENVTRYVRSWRATFNSREEGKGRGKKMMKGGKLVP